MARIVIVHPKSTTVVPPAVPEAPDIVRAALLAQASQGDHEGKVAEAALALWRRVDAELSPILGTAGIAALYRRSLYLLRAEYPALAAVHEATIQAGDFEPLQGALSSLSHTDAVAASQALMRAFCELLAGLIGAALAERLLKPAVQLPPNRPTSKDTPP